MAFMFESSLIPRICPWALESPHIDNDYYQCWIGLRSHFKHEAADGEKKELQTANSANGTILV